MSNPFEQHLRAQNVQSKHRRRLAEHWKIAPGSNVLEVGCGQGEMTSELAQVVGPNGHIQAVDIAKPEYGAPLTLRQATEIISASDLGPRIDFRLDYDLRESANSFAEDEFDYVVFAHSSWYFSTPGQLLDTFRVVRKLAKNLRFAEWNIEPSVFEQTPHLLAIFIQGQVEAFKSESNANVRTPLSKSQIEQLLDSAGWRIVSEEAIDTRELQDADWEVQGCLSSTPIGLAALDLPRKLVSMIEIQLELLHKLSLPKGNRPLPAYSICAERPV